MIPTIEENVLGFTGLWGKRIQLECGTLFINQELPNDIFFDKLTKITCTSEKMLDEAVSLFQKNLVLVLYCLGTVPETRNHGLASSLIDFALHEVSQRKLEFLMLETYEKDNLLDFYVKLGFEKLYRKSIYTI